MKEMNGFDVNGRKLKVSVLTDKDVPGGAKGKAAGGDYDLEEDSAN